MAVAEVLYLSMKDVIEAGGNDVGLALQSIQHVFECQASGDYVLPSKVVLRWGGEESEHAKGFINSMPGYIGGKYNIAGIKWIGSQPDNVARGLPQATAVVVLNDVATKIPLAIMEGSVISAMRTAAVTALAAKYLSKEKSFKLGIIGAGIIAKNILRAVLNVRPSIKEAFVFDIQKERAEKFSLEMSTECGINVRAVEKPEEAVKSMPIFFTATTSKSPVVKDGWMDEGAFYSQLAGFEAEMEVLINSDKVVLDNTEEVIHRGTSTLCRALEENLFKKESVYAELKDVVSGCSPGRENETERIFFNSVGMGIEDVAFAAEILKNARIRNIGKVIPFMDL